MHNRVNKHPKMSLTDIWPRRLLLSTSIDNREIIQFESKIVIASVIAVFYIIISIMISFFLLALVKISFQSYLLISLRHFAQNNPMMEEAIKTERLMGQN